MGSVIEYKECSCGNKDMSSDYHYKTEELFEFCDVCGYFHSITLKNKCEDGNYPDDWKPEYDEQEGRTGYVIKVFENDLEGHIVTCVDKTNLKQMLNSLKNDKLVNKFCVTFKDTNGYYQTQIFNKPKLYKFEVTHLIDVVSNNPDDYTIKNTVLAKNEVDAIKKVAISITVKDSSNIEWINSLKGNHEEVMKELMRGRYCFTNVIRID